MHDASQIEVQLVGDLGSDLPVQPFGQRVDQTVHDLLADVDEGLGGRSLGFGPARADWRTALSPVGRRRILPGDADNTSRPRRPSRSPFWCADGLTDLRPRHAGVLQLHAVGKLVAKAKRVLVPIRRRRPQNLQTIKLRLELLGRRRRGLVLKILGGKLDQVRLDLLKLPGQLELRQRLRDLGCLAAAGMPS